MERPINIPDDPNEATAQLTLEIINRVAGSNEHLAELIRATALPHRFDVSVIEALQAEFDPKINSAKLFERLKTFSFTTEVDEQTLTYHEKSREAILLFWREPENMARYVYFSRLLKVYFETQVDEFEALYHWFVVDADVAFVASEALSKQFFKIQYRLTETEVLVRTLDEQKWQFTDEQLHTLVFTKARLYQMLSNWELAISHYKSILNKKDFLTPKVKAASLSGIGSCLMYLKRDNEAIIALQESIDIARKHNEVSDILISTLITLGAHYLHRFSESDNKSKTISTLKEALVLSETHSQKLAQCNILSLLGVAYRMLEKKDTAVDYQLRALEILDEKDSFIYRVRVLRRLALAYVYIDDTPKAIKYMDEALAISLKSGSNLSLLSVYRSFGDLYKKTKQFLVSIDYYEKALPIAIDIEAYTIVIDLLNNLINVCREVKEESKLNFYSKKLNNLRQKLDV
ncbi:tetratricopeptide repeat protein [Anaerolineales bacterium HSG24]|nr:tetratricopeptide repeat protein [Anaerolineales bacterium HSG24]